MFLTGQNCLFQMLERHAQVRAPGRRRQRAFEINNFALSETRRILLSVTGFINRRKVVFCIILLCLFVLNFTDRFFLRELNKLPSV